MFSDGRGLDLLRIVRACRAWIFLGVAAAVAPGWARADPREDYTVSGYSLDLELRTGSAEILGTVAMAFHSVSPLPRIVVDLALPLEIDSAWTGQGPADPARRNAEQVQITLPEILAADRADTLFLRYRGRPVDSSGTPLFQPLDGGGSLFTSPWGDGAARRFWPCKDVASDKAAVRLRVLAPEALEVAATGVPLGRSPASEGRVVSAFRSLFECAPDWFGVQAGPGSPPADLSYASPETGIPLPLRAFAFPADSARALDLWRRVVADPDSGILATLEERFGPYPFADSALGAEPLSLVEIARAEALPAQGLARQGEERIAAASGSVRDSAEAAVHDLAALLARQWYGASVTPQGPEDRWMTDGFAAYAAALVAEARGGFAAYRAAMEGLDRDAFTTPVVPPLPANEAPPTGGRDGTAAGDGGGAAANDGSMAAAEGRTRADDGRAAAAEAASAAAAAKGAWVLHTLRWVLRNLGSSGAAIATRPSAPPDSDRSALSPGSRGADDALFFEILRGFAASPRYRHGSAGTADFVRFAEETAAADLHWFFGPWLFGTGRPRLAVDWSAQARGSGFVAHLHLDVTGRDPQYPGGEPYPESPRFFPMFWEVLLEGPDGASTRVVLHQTSRAQDFEIPLAHPVLSVTLDPDHWVLRDLAEIPRGGAVELISLGPNPSSGRTIILYRVPADGSALDLSVFDAAGRRIRRLATGPQAAGAHVIEWNGAADDGSRPAQGVYWVRAAAGGRTQARSLVVLRP